MLEENPVEIDYLLNPVYAEILFEAARRNGSLKEFKYSYRNKQESIEYALLDPDNNWQVPVEDRTFFNTPRTINMDLTGLIRAATEQQIPALFVAEEDTLYFVFQRNVPEKFIPFVLLHEITESGLQGVGEGCTMDIAHAMSEDGKPKMAEKFIRGEMERAYRYPHQQGCLTELSNVFDEGESFSKDYSDWLLRLSRDIEDPTTIFNQASPGFLTRNNRLQKSSLQIVVEFYCVLIGPCFTNYRREKLFKKWPWINSYLPNGELLERPSIIYFNFSKCK